MESVFEINDRLRAHHKGCLGLPLVDICIRITCEGYTKVRGVKWRGWWLLIVSGNDTQAKNNSWTHL